MADSKKAGPMEIALGIAVVAGGIYWAIGDSTPAANADDDPASLPGSLTCVLPPDVREHTPLLGLTNADKDREKLAREHIEYERRRELNEGSWSLATTMFYTKQWDLARLKGTMDSDREKARNWRNAEARTNSQLFDEPLDNVIAARVQLFKETCDQYIEVNRFLTEREKDLEALRNEKKQPWLDPSRTLPCDILNVKGCLA